jgi:hypothetical protein
MNAEHLDIEALTRIIVRLGDEMKTAALPSRQMALQQQLDDALALRTLIAQQAGTKMPGQHVRECALDPARRMPLHAEQGPSRENNSAKTEG